MEKGMFCYQCQETAHGTGCTVRGVCGKECETSAAMDLLLSVVKGVSVVACSLRKEGVEVCDDVNKFVTDALFTTITNANFDNDAIVAKVEWGLCLKSSLLHLAEAEGVDVPDISEVTWSGGREMYCERAKVVGVLREPCEDKRSMKELIVYGLKGIAAYHEHAMRLGFCDNDIHDFVQCVLAKITVGKRSACELGNLFTKVGEYGVRVMELLDRAHTESFGHPEMTRVMMGVGNRPGILISGHDMKDMEELLRQTEGEGVDVYTHGEMLPAHYYPAFKRYQHLVGNYGGAWWRQREEFARFNGPILFTSNCIVPPREGAEYLSRVFTTNSAGYSGCRHVKQNEDGSKDFSELIAMAKRSKAPEAIDCGVITGGFAHHQTDALADEVVEAVRNGAIRKFVVMAGCDGRMPEREYYTEFAKALPDDCVILTAGCAKYRYIKLRLGDIEGIPRVLDAGQCNDSYSLVLTLQRLQKLLGYDCINDMPVVYNIAWYEQKAVIVLLALLSLGIRNIHIGPTLPAFMSPCVRKFLMEKYDVGTISTVENDLREIKVEG